MWVSIMHPHAGYCDDEMYEVQWDYVAIISLRERQHGGLSIMNMDGMRQDQDNDFFKRKTFTF
jgi:hypothetical protein